MKRAKSYTKGPWKTVRSPHGKPSEYLCVQIGKDELYTTLELLPADAKLIAASPNLFESVKPVAEEIENKLPTPSEQTYNPDYHIEITLSVAECHAIRAAFQKATCPLDS